MAGSHQMDNNSERPVLFLEIDSGQTRFPRRPVRPGRFVIGSHPTCQMQIGGEEMPLVHSLLIADEAGVVIERIASQPAVIVNGEEFETAELDDVDHVQIGGVAFLVRFEESFVPIRLESDNDSIIEFSSLAEDDENIVSELSAAELVDLLTADMELIQDFDDGHSRGLAGLVDAALTVNDPSGDSEMDDFDLENPESVYRHLARISDELNERAAALRTAEKFYTNQANDLLQQQELLSAQLDNLVERIRARTIPLRKSA